MPVGRAGQPATKDEGGKVDYGGRWMGCLVSCSRKLMLGIVDGGLMVQIAACARTLPHFTRNE